NTHIHTMRSLQSLLQRQASLKQAIADHLDLLIGSVGKSPAMGGYNLTTKIGGKTVTLYVRKSIAAQAQQMTRRHRKVRTLIQQLSRVNWQLLQQSAED
ncbi:MAG: hypothetical protein HW378_4137, partial [Anaerolineales bacterium]|nr:hypothetical protein [Anaerolineales bacterium]